MAQDVIDAAMQKTADHMDEMSALQEEKGERRHWADAGETG